MDNYLTRREYVLLLSGLRDMQAGRVKSFAQVEKEMEMECAMTGRLQQTAEEIVREMVGAQHHPSWKSESLRQSLWYRLTLAGLTAGIAMAAPGLVELRSLWMERAKRLRKDPSYTDCAVTLESCADELSSLRALAKGETQHG